MKQGVILALVPNENIRENFLNLAQKHPDVRMDVHVANFYEAVALVQQKADTTDVIVARGQTAQMVRETTDIPVIEIPLTIFDVLHATRLAENFRQPYAILGFQELTSEAQKLKNLLDSKTDIFTLHAFEEADQMMQSILDAGYKLIVTGMGTEHIARRHGINTIQVNTNIESLEPIVRQAAVLAKALAGTRHKVSLLAAAMRAVDTDFIIFSGASQSLVFSNLHRLKEEDALTVATKEFQLSARGDADIVKTINACTYAISRREFVIDDDVYVAFAFKPKEAMPPSFKDAITVFSKDTAIDAFLAHFPETRMSAQTLPDTLNDLAKSPLPVILLGEYGTGKSQVAASIYTRCAYQNHPYYRIISRNLEGRAWNALFHKINSPLFGSGNTIFFQDIEDLPLSKVERISTFLHDSKAHLRNKIVCSYSTPPGSRLPEEIQSMMNDLSCLDLRLRPLRQRQMEMHMIISLHLATANLTYGKHIVGMTENAERAIKKYPWPGNLLQFNRVINKLVSRATSAYIQESEVAEALREENENHSDSHALPNILDIDRPLHEIEKDIINVTLAKSKGNKSLAASKLQISRTTLWRFLQESGKA